MDNHQTSRRDFLGISFGAVSAVARAKTDFNFYGSEISSIEEVLNKWNIKYNIFDQDCNDMEDLELNSKTIYSILISFESANDVERIFQKEGIQPIEKEK